jgi:cation diffusion facilitator family transporter
MSELLIQKFIRNYADTDNPAVRLQYGTFSGIVGIIVNFALFAVKLTIGILSGAISIIADALHNLSDAASAVVTLLGFKLAAKPADTEHPFGHGRIEYLTGLLISFIILMVGIELLETSVDKILHPAAISIGGAMIVFLLISIALQLWLGRFNRTIGCRINSAAIEAAAADSLNDCVATGVVLFSLGVNYFAGYNVDGIAGIFVACFVLHSGWGAAKATIQPLLGRAPEPAFVKALEEAVLAEKAIRGMHDLIIHDYGPGRIFVSLHVEIPADMDIMKAHELIDGLEMRLHGKFRLEVTVHMDPVVVNNPEIDRLRRLMEKAVAETDSNLSMHDFRMTTTYDSGRNLIFDVVVPADCQLTDREVRQTLCNKAAALDKGYHAVVRIDHLYS